MQEGGRKVQNEKQTDLKKIIKAKQKEQREQLEREVITELKKKEDVVRNVVDKKKCAIVFGMK